MGDGEDGGDGEGGVGHAADDVEGRRRRDGGEEEGGDLGEEIRVGDDEAEIDVDGGGDAGLEGEGAELQSLDRVEREN